MKWNDGVADPSLVANPLTGDSAAGFIPVPKSERHVTTGK